MASYRIDFCRSALKDLRRLDKHIVPRVIAAIEELAENPRPSGARKLQGSACTYRIRVGDYRVVYSVDDQLLVLAVTRVRHRKEVYD